MMDNENANNTAEKQQVGIPFKPGQSGNPEGRPKGSKNYLTLLEEALKDYEKTHNKKLFARLIERAFINDKVLLGTIKKFIPDKTHTEIETTEPVEIVIHRAKDES